MRIHRRLVRVCLATVSGTLAAVAAVAAAAPAPASAAPRWASPNAAALHPGVMVFTKGSQCTANFVFTDRRGIAYLGQAAHCSSRGTQSDTNGCTTKSWPLGTVVQDAAGHRIGTLAYNSWLAMHAAREKDANACAANDLALVRLDRAMIGRTSPTFPGLGGPTGVRTAPLGLGSPVYAVGNSSLLGGLGALVAQVGVVQHATYGGWAYYVAMLRPGIPGDSGSGYVDAQGRAVGQLSTISVGTQGVGNTVGNLGREIAYARTHGVRGLTVVNGQTPFRGLTGLVTPLG